MPIRPENKKRYPPNWREISERIRRRSRGRCECRGECGVSQGVKHTTWSGRCDARNGQRHPETGSKVVLTVMHLNHRPEDCTDENLLAACQKCHNRYDAPVRAAGIKARRKKQMAMGDLFQ